MNFILRWLLRKQEMNINQVNLLLSTQIALTTHISPLLRAVIVDWLENENKLILRFFYDCKVTDKLFDLASCTSVEINPHIFPYDMNNDIAVCLEYPQEIPIEGRLVYLRKEPTPTLYKQKSAVELADTSITLIAQLCLAMQDSLLGKVTPELRRVTIGVEEQKKQFDFYFFYDGEISKENSDLANAAIDEACIHFPKFAVNRHIFRLDYPQRFPDLGTRSPYARYEENF